MLKIREISEMKGIETWWNRVVSWSRYINSAFDAWDNIKKRMTASAILVTDTATLYIYNGR